MSKEDWGLPHHNIRMAKSEGSCRFGQVLRFFVEDGAATISAVAWANEWFISVRCKQILGDSGESGGGNVRDGKAWGWPPYCHSGQARSRVYQRPARVA
jgi:hypothetical protein